MSEHSRARLAAAWGVHAYTALGLPLALVVVHALWIEDVRLLFAAMVLATAVDATDGVLARWVGVGEVLPHFDGRRLDDLVDFLHFAFLPALVLWRLELVSHPWLAAVVLVASGYGFSQQRAKTEDAFVGFPSYWNILALYLFAWGAPAWVGSALVLFLAALVFVPIHYVYPTKTALLRPLTIGAGAVWGVALLVIALSPEARWVQPLAWVSVIYPAYYLALSLVHDRRVRRRAHS